ncbi:hypothetical protein M4S82_10525 [Planococcus sp. MERTA32b]|nr:hypothetical protein [Planococcus sp. MER TA 32b]
MSEDKILNNLNEIDEIVLSNPICGDLSLQKVTDDKLEAPKKYKEVFISDLSLMTGNVSQTALQVANQGLTLAQIAKEAPHGLFAATTNPSNLSKFANGTTSTMVRDASGHLVEHAGFAEVGLSVAVNPAIILSAGMQAMSAISGTYYLHKINARFNDLNTKLEELSNMHHDNNIGRLVAARKGLYEIANKEFIDIVDLSTIRNYKMTADDVSQEYMYRLSRREGESNSKIDKVIEEQKLKDINFTIEVAFEANKLSLYAQLIEIRARMKLIDQTEIIEEQTRQLKYNYSNSLYFNCYSRVEDIYSVRQQQSSEKLIEKKKKLKKSVNELKESNIFTKYEGLKFAYNGCRVFKYKHEVDRANEIIMLEDEHLNRVKNDIKQNKDSDKIDSIINDFVELPYKEKEILYIPMKKKQRIFVQIEDE